MYRWWHFLAESAARALPFPKSQRPTCPLSFTPGGTPPARPSAAPASARCEPVPAFPLLPGPPTCPAKPSAAPVASRCEPFSVNSLPPGPSTNLAWLSAASAPARCEPFSANRLTPASRNSGAGQGTMVASVREQAASCDAFVLSRRLPAPEAPPSRTSPAGLIDRTRPRTTARSLAEQGPPLRIPSGSVKDTTAGQRSGRG